MRLVLEEAEAAVLLLVVGRAVDDHLPQAGYNCKSGSGVRFRLECRATVLLEDSITVQGDHSGRTKPPVDFKTQVPLWPDQASPGHAKTELLFSGQREVLDSVMCHPVHITENQFRLVEEC